MAFSLFIPSQPFFSLFSSTPLSANPLTGSPDMALEFPRMVQLGTYFESRNTRHPNTVESWWRSLNDHRTQSAASAPVRTLMTCVSALPQQVHQLRRGGCHNRFTLAA